jgi:hypothetical protein
VVRRDVDRLVERRAVLRRVLFRAVLRRALFRAVLRRAVDFRAEDLRPLEERRLVVRLAFLPPIARELSRLPRAPTRDLPSRSC